MGGGEQSIDSILDQLGLDEDDLYQMVEDYTNTLIDNVFEDYGELKDVMKSDDAKVSDILSVYEKELRKSGFDDEEIKKEMELIDEYYTVAAKYTQALASKDNVQIMKMRQEYKNFYVKFQMAGVD